MNDSNILENSSEIIEIIIDGLEYLSGLPLYTSILHSQLISHMIPALEQTMTSDQKHICSHLVSFVKETFEFSSLTPLTIQIVNKSLYSKN